jgi:RNA polymerase sigma factor (sigma-70 family)
VSEERFNRLYERNARDLLGYLVRRTEGHENAADCLAETFLVAWRKRDEIPSDEAAARPWVFGIARNVVRRERELDNKRSRAVEALASELRHTRTMISTDDPGMAALKLLSPIDREIIEMLAWDQLSPREVAVVLELSPNVVRIRAHRSRLKLREHLQTGTLELGQRPGSHAEPEGVPGDCFRTRP